MKNQKKLPDKNKHFSNNITAISLVRDERGWWAIASLGIKDQKVETLDVTKFDVLNMTMTRAHQILQQQVIDLRKTPK